MKYLRYTEHNQVFVFPSKKELERVIDKNRGVFKMEVIEKKQIRKIDKIWGLAYTMNEIVNP